MDKAEELRTEIVILYHKWASNMLPIDDYYEKTNDLIDEYAQQVSRGVAIDFGIWIKKNQGRENFDFRRGDSDEYFNEWIKNQ